MVYKLYQLLGWQIFKFSKAPWGEKTYHWTDGDWIWFRSYDYKNRKNTLVEFK